MASITMNDSLRDTPEEFMNHDRLVIFRNRIKSLLDNVATKSIHGEIQGIASNRFSNLDDLLWSTMLEATLNQEVSKSINHQWVSLSNDGFNDIILLLSSTNLQLLLEEDGSLLVIIADNLINNVLPIAVDSAIKKTTVVEGFSGRKIGLTFCGNSLADISRTNQSDRKKK
jgi:hypothetical protein